MATQRLSVTAFAADKVALDIIDAMLEAKRTGLPQYLKNRKGHPWLRVAIKRDDSGRQFYQFLDRGNRECGHIIRRCALTRWNLFVLRQFERLELQILQAGLGDEWRYAGPEVRHIIAANNTTAPAVERKATQAASPLA